MFFSAKTTGNGPDNVLLYFHVSRSPSAIHSRLSSYPFRSGFKTRLIAVAYLTWTSAASLYPFPPSPLERSPGRHPTASVPLPW